MLEIDRLEGMLKEASIPFVCNGEDFRQEHDCIRFQILYPNSYKRVCSVVQGACTYGGLENRLEIMGLLTEEEAENDSVCGWLTAEDVFERIKTHWEMMNGENNGIKR